MEKREEYRIIVAHPFQQHSFRTAAALKQKGLLYKYITTVYYKRGTLAFAVNSLLKKNDSERAKHRRSDLLEDSDVLVFSEFKSLILLLLQRIDKRDFLYDFWLKRTINSFNNKLFRYLKKEQIDAVVLYDTVSGKLAEKIKKSGIPTKIIIDMSAPDLSYMIDIIRKELPNVTMDTTNDQVSIERELKVYVENSSLEKTYSDYFFVASDFTKQSLIKKGICNERIFKCVYGIDQYTTPLEKVENNKRLRCVFVGRVCVAKGAYRLFDVINGLFEIADFHFYGGYSKESEYYHLFHDKVCFHGHIPHMQLIREICKADVLVFPSFADGFGLSVTEALSLGVVVICSSHAGVSELIQDGYNGFVYEPENEEKLSCLLRELATDTQKLVCMKKNAKESIVSNTWDKYYDEVNNAVNSIIGR